MKQQSLTTEQRKIVEDNHNLIYKFANKKNLVIEEYYDLLAIALCKAALYYNPEKYCFSTFAFSVMENALISYWRKLQAESMITSDNIVSLNNTVRFGNSKEEAEYIDIIEDNFNLEDFVISDLNCSYLLDLLSDKQKKVVQYRVKGMTEQQIANKLGIKHQNVNKLINRVRKTLQPYYNN